MGLAENMNASFTVDLSDFRPLSSQVTRETSGFIGGGIEGIKVPLYHQTTDETALGPSEIQQILHTHDDLI